MSNLSEDTTGSAKAIEVAAMLGDSVVDVKHCMDPQAGKLSRKTWGLAAAGLACVLFSAASFGIGINTAARNKTAFDTWTHVAKKPAGAFRAEQLSFGFDWAAFGGLALGVGALAGALSRSRRERRSPFYNIGTGANVQQPVLGAPTESFPLVAPRGDDFVFNFGAGISGEAMVAGGAPVKLADLAASGAARPSSTIPGAFELPIPLHGRIRATVGQTSFLISGVVKPNAQPAPILSAIESRTMGYFAGSLAAHLGLVLLLSNVAIEDSSAQIDISMIEDTLTKFDGTTPEDMPEENAEVVEQGGGGSEGAATTSMELDGTAGTTKTDRKDGKQRIEDRHTDAQLARLQAIEMARQSGILGSAAFASGDTFASLNAMADFASGPDAFDARGAIFGADGESAGTFGYGRSGFGAGCGGCAGGDGIIGTGGYGRIGFGKYGRVGYGGPGSGTPGSRRHTAAVPVLRVGDPTGSGNLDKAIIRRYIKRNLAKISYCYEKQLLAKQGLEGTVSVSFFITPTGVVKSSTGSGMDPTVASCVADVVSSIEFPRPSDGGVQVNYPFTFHPAGT